jgi:1,4-alpha-glucan branching enzyme
MPVTNVASKVDWGYLPVGYFGVDERFGGGDRFRELVQAAHERGIAVIVDAVYGHASRSLFGYEYLYDQLGYRENPFMGGVRQRLLRGPGCKHRLQPAADA